jgi:hypothetical protein
MSRTLGGRGRGPPDNTATWRDLADQLTPQQVAELEYCEREGIPPGMVEPRHQLNCAGDGPAQLHSGVVRRHRATC